MQAMASHSHPSGSTHFFKIILKSNLEAIRIPNKFTARYASGLSNPVFLKSPDGKEWKVYQTKHDNGVWFQKGWKEFARFYSLDEGHLILFKYDGTSLFDVCLFDKSALEIDYPSSSKNNLSDDTVEILDEMPPNQRAMKRTPLSSSRPHKKLKSLQNFHLGSKINPDQCQGTEFKKSTNAELKFPKKEPEEVKSRKRTKKEQISSMQQSPIEKASSFKSENPHFIVKMKHAYIDGRSNLHVPSQFARTHLHDCTESLKLVVQDVACPVEYVFRITPQGAQIHELSICGWKRFREDNDLKLGAGSQTQKFIAV